MAINLNRSFYILLHPGQNGTMPRSPPLLFDLHIHIRIYPTLIQLRLSHMHAPLHLLSPLPTLRAPAHPRPNAHVPL